MALIKNRLIRDKISLFKSRQRFNGNERKCIMKNLVSIVIPNYNKGAYLEDTLNSILSQTYNNLEIIIVDDGSTDNSVEILKKYEIYDNRIKVYYNEHLGKIEAINYGVSKANGDYIKTWGSDDCMQEYVIDELIKACIDEDVIAHNCVVTDEKLKIINENFIDMQEYIEDKVSIKSIIEGKGFPAGLYFMKRKIANLLYPLDLNISYEDWYIYMILALNNINIKYIDKSLGMYRQVPNSAFGGVNNFQKKIYRYRAERDIRMLEFFITILPSEYISIANSRISILKLSTQSSLRDVLRSNHSRKTKIKIIIKRYFYEVYHLYIKVKLTSKKLKSQLSN